MKAVKFGVLLILMGIAAHDLAAQSIGNRILRKVQQRADRKIDKTIDKGLDEAEKGIDETVKGEEGPKDKSPETKTGGSESKQETSASNSSGPTQPTFEAYSKFDFVPGEKVIVMEDFSQDAIGDFPAKWNTNGGGEVMTIEGQEGHWLALTTKGGVIPEFINSLPENFTLEFDLMVNPGFGYYDSYLMVGLVERTEPSQFGWWQTAVQLGLHPKDASFNPTGMSKCSVIQNGQTIIRNEASGLLVFNNKTRLKAHVGIWRQTQRVRLYVNESKIWDLPRAFKSGVTYNAIVFDKGDAKTNNNYFISNIRLAIGDPDTRNKLLTEGKFSTTGIYFNTNSADIKPESYGIIKEIADVLSSNPEVKVKVIGHTDSDGDEAHNLDLSKRRAEAVKEAIVTNFGIQESRIQTDGKGESQPTGPNNTPAGKAANRRVEFVKL
jgi:OmpA-OmpF porin, OOP family